MIHSAVSPAGWSLVDCHEYIADLEMSLTKAVAVLDMADPDQKERIRKLESQATWARGLALELGQKQLD
jgi:hypothetical protein